MCSSPLSQVTADDNLRLEAFDLSCCVARAGVNIDDLDQILSKLNKAEQLLNLRIQLGFKYIHQLEAAETVFTLAMLAGEMERAKSVALKGEQMALVRCGAGRQVDEWRKRKEDPLLYLLS